MKTKYNLKSLVVSFYISLMEWCFFRKAYHVFRGAPRARERSPKGLVKKYRGGGGGPEQRGGGAWGFEPCARGGSCNFRLPSGGGSPYFLLTTNETVDYTCYIKHSQLELLLKYSQTCCARKYKGWQAAQLHGRGTLCQPFFFGSNEHVL